MKTVYGLAELKDLINYMEENKVNLVDLEGLENSSIKKYSENMADFKTISDDEYSKKISTDKILIIKDKVEIED